jgi:hypothetical protein
MVFQVQRHGVRASNTIFNHLMDETNKEKNFKKPQDLHPESSEKIFGDLAENHMKVMLKPLVDLTTDSMNTWNQQVNVRITDAQRT